MIALVGDGGYPPAATRMDGMDLLALAEAMDCDGARADSPAALEKALSGFAARSYSMDAALMSSQQHERGIHALYRRGRGT